MTGSTRHYFARGNTAHGEFLLYEHALKGMEKVYVLQGYPGTGKSRMLQTLADRMIHDGWDVELFHSPLNPEDLDAVFITQLKTGIVDGDACRFSTVDAETVSIDFNRAVDVKALPENIQETIEQLQVELSEAYSKAYGSFAEALRIHDEWESFYIESMDFRKANEVAQEMVESIIGTSSLEKKAAVRHLFFGAATPLGAIDHIQNLTSDVDTRIFIKGRAGSGKSTLLKRLAADAEAKGYDVDVFHCGFDPNSLDMLIFPELRLAIFDSTAPHEYFPDRASDRILDMYERVILPGIDERYAAELDVIKSRYSQQMKKATSFLAEARDIHTRIKSVYTASTDFSFIDQLLSQLQEELRGTMRETVG